MAVSDISLIQKEAQILSYVSRVEQIAFIESMLLGESLRIIHFRQLFQILQTFSLPIGDPFRFLTNYPPFSWAQKLPPCDCFRSMYSLGPMRWLLNKMMGNTLLFTDRLKNKRHSIYIRTVSSQRLMFALRAELVETVYMPFGAEQHSDVVRGH